MICTYSQTQKMCIRNFKFFLCSTRRFIGVDVTDIGSTWKSSNFFWVVKFHVPNFDVNLVFCFSCPLMLNCVNNSKFDMHWEFSMHYSVKYVATLCRESSCQKKKNCAVMWQIWYYMISVIRSAQNSDFYGNFGVFQPVFLSTGSWIQPNITKVVLIEHRCI